MDSTSLTQEAEHIAVGAEPVYFRHDIIRRFKVGPYEFVDHIIAVPEDRVDDFLLTISGCAPIDQNAIRQVMEIRNERSLSEFKKTRVIRGAADAKSIVDPTKAAAAGDEGKEGENGSNNPGLSRFLQATQSRAGQGPTT